MFPRFFAGKTLFLLPFNVGWRKQTVVADVGRNIKLSVSWTRCTARNLPLITASSAFFLLSTSKAFFVKVFFCVDPSFTAFCSYFSCCYVTEFTQFCVLCWVRQLHAAVSDSSEPSVSIFGFTFCFHINFSSCLSPWFCFVWRSRCFVCFFCVFAIFFVHSILFVIFVVANW